MLRLFLKPVKRNVSLSGPTIIQTSRQSLNKTSLGGNIRGKERIQRRDNLGKASETKLSTFLCDQVC